MLINRALILGYGTTGKAVATFLESKNIAYAVTDQKRQEDHSLKHFSFLTHEEAVQFTFDTLIVSPGIAPTNPVYAFALKNSIPCIGEIELALQYIDIPVIGITGTNGKTTVTKLVAEGLNFLNLKAVPCGNYGLPLISLVNKQNEYQVFVCELSSYQLETMFSKKLVHSAFLNLTQDHLDRYASMQEYLAAKLRIVDLTEDSGRVVINQTILDEFKLEKKSSYEMFGPGFRAHQRMSDEAVSFVQFIHSFPLPNYGQTSSKEAENWIAAFLLLEPFGMTAQKMISLLSSFEKPSHRIEFVKEIDEIRFYDDSKGTNVDAVIFAVEKFQQPVVLLIGGKDKSSDYTPWIATLKNKVKCLIAFGEAREKMQRQLSKDFDFYSFITLEEATQFAYQIAKKGDVVLLSPGCSSYDAFKDYKHRGESYKEYVRAL